MNTYMLWMSLVSIGLVVYTAMTLILTTIVAWLVWTRRR